MQYDELANLAAQLPGEIQEAPSRYTGPAETFDIDEFLQRLAAYEGPGRTHGGSSSARRRPGPGSGSSAYGPRRPA